MLPYNYFNGINFSLVAKHKPSIATVYSTWGHISTLMHGAWCMRHTELSYNKHMFSPAMHHPVAALPLLFHFNTDTDMQAQKFSSVYSYKACSS